MGGTKRSVETLLFFAEADFFLTAGLFNVEGALLAFGFGDAAHLFALGSKRSLLGSLGFTLGLKAGRQVVEEAAAIGQDATPKCFARVFLAGRCSTKFTGGSLA